MEATSQRLLRLPRCFLLVVVEHIAYPFLMCPSLCVELSKSWHTGPHHQRASVGPSGVWRVLAARADSKGRLPGHARGPAWAERQVGPSAAGRAACAFLLPRRGRDRGCEAFRCVPRFTGSASDTVTGSAAGRVRREARDASSNHGRGGQALSERR
eukprot:4290772-Amphidinium_carterae.1